MIMLEPFYNMLGLVGRLLVRYVGEELFERNDSVILHRFLLSRNENRSARGGSVYDF